MPKSTTDQRRGAPIEYKLKMPDQGELIGTVSKIAGASKFFVDCTDGKQRLCAIPGRFRRRFWIKENDVVIVKPWMVQGDQRGDIVWRYSALDVNKLRDKHII